MKEIKKLNAIKLFTMGMVSSLGILILLWLLSIPKTPFIYQVF
jgi:hypothetical protein